MPMNMSSNATTAIPNSALSVCVVNTVLATNSEV